MHVRLLGPIEAILDGRTIHLGTKKQRALLAMLALRPNTSVGIDQLIEGLWGEQPPASAAKMVQLYVSQLRRVLGDNGAEIVTHGRGYELRVTADHVDAARFERLVDAPSDNGSACAREALALWRGTPLADVADEPFAAAEIRRLGELRLRATERAIEDDLSAGRHRELIGELDALVAEHPLSERLHAQRMLALYRSGRQAEALEAYRHARAVLVDEIGVEPGPELRGLHDAVLRQDPALDPPTADAAAAVASPPAATQPRAPAARGHVPARRVLLAAAGLALVVGLAVFAVSRSSGPELLPRIDENQVGLIDPDHGGITEQYEVGRGATAMTAGGGSVWVANSRDATVSRIDRQRHIWSIPVEEDPAGLAFAAGSLWVTNRRDGTVSQIDPATNRVMHEIPVGNAPHAIASGHGAVWVASDVDRTVTRIDLTRDAPMLPIDLGANPTAVATGAGAVWVASEEGGTVFRIEPRSGQVVKSIDVGNGPIGVVVADGAVWVANRQDGTVSRIDPATDRVTHLVPVGRDPATIAAGKGAVWVGNGEGTVMRIDTGKRRVADTIRVANSPTAMVVADGSAWTAARAAPASHRGGTLRIEMVRPYVEPNLEPAAYDAGGIYRVLSLAHDGLVAYRRSDGSTFGALVGGLAIDVPDPSPDGKTYVFKLRRGIRYSDGAAVRPEDFRASLEAFLRHYKRTPYLPRFYEHIVGAPVCMDHPASCDLSQGIVTDARAGTITIHLSKPDPDLLPRLAFPFAYVAPAARPFRPKEAPPGTGPYRIVSFDPKRGARLVRNPYFRAGSFDARPDGLVDEIRVRIRGTGRLEAAVAAVENGDADSVVIAGAFGGPWPAKRIAALAVRAPGRLYTDAAPETDWMFLNVRTPPFNDVRVRRALNYAVDRREVARRAGGADLAQLTCQLPPPGTPGYTPSCPYTANPNPGGGWSAPDMDRARRLIEQSGTKGQKITVWGLSEKHAITQYFVSLLRRLGYRSSLREFPLFTDYASRAYDSRSRAQIGINGWASDLPTADDITTQFRCAMLIPGTANANPSGFCRRRIEDRIDEALAARGADADSIWQDVYRRLSNAAPAVPLVNRRTLTLVSKRVGNYQHHPLWGPLYDQMWVR